MVHVFSIRRSNANGLRSLTTRMRVAGMFTLWIAVFALVQTPSSAFAVGERRPAQTPSQMAPSDEEISRLRIFEEPLLPLAGPATATAENRALADALAAYQEHSEPEQVEPLETFLKACPRSAWRASLWLDIGLIYRRAGYFSRALEAWENGWFDSKRDFSPEGVAIATRAVGELAELNARLGRYERLEELFEELGDFRLEGAGAEKVIRAREGLAIMQLEPEVGFQLRADGAVTYPGVDGDGSSIRSDSDPLEIEL